MADKTSGIYVVDKDFVIQNFNPSAKSIYPTLKLGAKCHKVLMGLDSPCAICPIVRGLVGPRQYLDPIRKVNETVDCVEITLPKVGKCHALIFSDVTEEGAEENNVDDKLSDLVVSLTNNYSDLYEYDLEENVVTCIRGHNPGGKPTCRGEDFRRFIDAYIDSSVYEEDRPMAKKATDISYILKELSVSESMKVHLRVLFEGELHYYFMKVSRNMHDLNKIYFGFMNEDDDIIRNRMLNKDVIKDGRKNILLIEDNYLDRQLLKDLLENEYNVIEATDASSGLGKLNDNANRLSMAIISADLKHQGGLDLLNRVSANKILSSIPIVVSTSSKKVSEKEKYLSLGASAIINKPFNYQAINDLATALTSKRESSLAISSIELDSLTGFYTKEAFIHYASRFFEEKNIKCDLLIATIAHYHFFSTQFGNKEAKRMSKYIASFLAKEANNALLVGVLSDHSFAMLFRHDDSFDENLISSRTSSVVHESKMSGFSFVQYGIYRDIDPGDTIASAIDSTIEAMGLNKGIYGQYLSYYDRSAIEAKKRRLEMESSFQSALDNEEFVVYYQPKVSLITSSISGAEALIRWKKPDGKMVPPGEFINLFERDGLIGKLDEYVFREVCYQLRKWIDDGRVVVPISVNLSKVSLSIAGLAEKYHDIAREYGVDPSLIPIEITESTGIRASRLKDLADTFFREGFQLHMDDFGAGYSSLAGLQIVNYDTIKLDKSLIDFIGTAGGESLLRHTIAFAHENGNKVVAEGVENQQQLRFLRDVGCDAIQGYLFSAPVPIEKFEEILYFAKAKIAGDESATSYELLDKKKTLTMFSNGYISSDLYNDIVGPIGVYYRKGDRVLLCKANERFLELFGRRYEELMDDNTRIVNNVIDPEYLDDLFDTMDKARKNRGRGQVREYGFHDLWGKKWWIRLNIRFLRDWDGGYIYMLSFTDMTAIHNFGEQKSK